MNQSPPLPGPCFPHPTPTTQYPGWGTCPHLVLKHASHSGPGLVLLGGSTSFSDDNCLASLACILPALPQVLRHLGWDIPLEQHLSLLEVLAGKVAPAGCLEQGQVSAGLLVSLLFQPCQCACPEEHLSGK